jgi:hypothetical protein
MAEISFDRTDLTFYDDDSEESIKKNINTLYNLVYKEGLLTLERFAKDKRKYNSYFMKFVKILSVFLMSDAHWKFSTQWIKLEEELNSEVKYYHFNKALKQILLDSFEFMDVAVEFKGESETKEVMNEYDKKALMCAKRDPDRDQKARALYGKEFKELSDNKKILIGKLTERYTQWVNRHAERLAKQAMGSMRKVV